MEVTSSLTRLHLPRKYLEEKIGAEKREGDDSGTAEEDDLKHRKQEPG